MRVIGRILSHFADVQDVVRASWTCRKWRAAFRHLHTLPHEYVEVFHLWEIGDEEQELEHSYNGHNNVHNVYKINLQTIISILELIPIDNLKHR